MEPFKSILVDIDAAAAVHPALDHAVRLARQTGANLTITDVILVPENARRFLTAALEEELLGRRRDQLTRVADGLTGVQATPKLLVGRPATVLIQEVLRDGHDLLMRSHARDLSAPRDKPFGAVDMALLRKCPCPVFLVRARDEGPMQVVGAVDASADEAVEQTLNLKIAELTLDMARLEDGTATLLHAWAPFAEQVVRSHYSDEDFAAYVDAVRQQSASGLARLRESVGARGSGLETVSEHGEPEDVIPEFVVANGVDLVVMGTVARTGIAGLVIGNTAERVLRKLPCSVLAVKPDGYVCPVKLES